MAAPTPDPSKPYSRYRKAHGIVTLPVEGCTLPVPKLPGGRDWSKDERATWRELWKSPQAVMWEDSYIPVVAMFVAHSSAVLSGDASAWQAQEARFLADRLGLTPAGMAGLGWRLPMVSDKPAPVVPLPGVS